MDQVLDAVLAWIPEWEDDAGELVQRCEGDRQRRRDQRRLRLARGSRTPHRTDLFLDVRVPPTKPMGDARRQVMDFVRSLRDRFPDYGIEGEIYVTAPGAEIAADHPLVGAIEQSHESVFGTTPERDVTRWFSDASALTRYGIPTVNYGTSTGLLDEEYGENLDIEGLAKMTKVYALAAMNVCGVAR